MDDQDGSDLFNPDGDGHAPKSQVMVAALGASAGGIKALKEFFAKVPSDSGIAYVVVLHLSPDHESKLAEVLQAMSPVPVTQVNAQVKVEANHVYVISPNNSLEAKDGYLAVSEMTRVEERRAPVDIFFRTLAESHGSNAVCVILSGTGANGSMGLKRIKELGGVCIVQDPNEAEYADMPRNSIATGLADYILPVGQIPGKIVAYKNRLGTVNISAAPEQRAESDERALREIFIQLRQRTGHDFSNYKRSTVLRRIERRISLHELPDLPSYALFIRQEPDEARALLKDLLISVTNFFRDVVPFEALEKHVIPKLFEGKGPKDHVRVWVAGCATGEEAYSIAMLLAEHVEGLIDGPAVQLFATDIDEWAIARARDGYYTLNDAADVSPERLRRFFVKEGDGYRIRREIRETVLFSTHNLIKDPPFSHVDLVSCRNLLIYLNRSAQQRAMQILHFALNPNGFLFLGTSESAEGAGDLFVLYDKENHIYQSRPVEARLPMPLPDLSLTKQLQQRAEMRPTETPVQDRLSFRDLHQRLLEQYAPPSVIVNEEYQILHLSDTAGRYMQISGGEPSVNLLKLIRPELRLEVHTALYQAVQRKQNVEARNVKIEIEGKKEQVNVIVRPVLQTGDTVRGFILVLFEPTEAEARETGQTPSILVPAEPIARQLEEELMRVRSQLRAANEDHELQQEELKAANEELQAMNEELRSSAEELETSTEELQSVNEEMTTVNQELKIKVEELTQSNNDVQNLMNSTEIGTIFLDRASRVKLFTPSARGIFNLIAADLGRPLSDITNKLVDTDLVADIEQVVERLQPVDREIRTTDERSYLMRILPYRTTEDRINGVVLTFTDVTERRHSDLEKQSARQVLERKIDDYVLRLSNAPTAAEVVQRLIEARDDERRKMGSDLHDQLGQQLTAMRLNIEVLKARLVEDGKAFEQAEQVQTIARRIESEIDFLAWGLRPLALEDMGLPSATKDYVERWSEHTGIAAEFHSNGLEGHRLTPEIETNLYRILQEALNNVHKHSQSKSVDVVLERRDSEVVLIVEDHGIGGAAPSKSGDGGMGLTSMQERAELLGGTLEIESHKGKGTTIFAKVPAGFVAEKDSNKSSQ